MPIVSKISGNETSFSSSPSVAFRNTNTNAAISAVANESMRKHGTSRDTSSSATALNSQLIKSRTILPPPAYSSIMLLGLPPRQPASPVPTTPRFSPSADFANAKSSRPNFSIVRARSCVKEP